LKETLDDLSGEESDAEFERKQSVKVKFRRPPKTSKEAMQALKEADARFEVNKKYLVGRHGALKTSELPKEEDRNKLLQNVPKGISLSRLVCPNSDGSLSTVILLGVKRRTMIHASYVYDFLETFKPEMIFVQ
jgi:hypothetical protein